MLIYLFNYSYRITMAAVFLAEFIVFAVIGYYIAETINAASGMQDK